MVLRAKFQAIRWTNYLNKSDSIFRLLGSASYLGCPAVSFVTPLLASQCRLFQFLFDLTVPQVNLLSLRPYGVVPVRPFPQYFNHGSPAGTHAAKSIILDRLA